MSEQQPKPHPHAYWIKLWADGVPIEYKACGKWIKVIDFNITSQPDIEYRIKPEEHKPWKPEDGEEYFFIENDGDIGDDDWLDESECCQNRLKLGNCFRTVEAAKAAIPRMERALKNLYAISDKKAHDLECELYDKIDRLTKYPEIDGKPLTEGEIALIKALRTSKIHYVCESSTVAIEGHNDINGAKLVQNAFSFVPASKHHYAELSVAIKQIKSEQESTK